MHLHRSSRKDSPFSLGPPFLEGHSAFVCDQDLALTVRIRRRDLNRRFKFGWLVHRLQVSPRLRFACCRRLFWEGSSFNDGTTQTVRDPPGRARGAAVRTHYVADARAVTEAPAARDQCGCCSPCQCGDIRGPLGGNLRWKLEPGCRASLSTAAAAASASQAGLVMLCHMAFALVTTSSGRALASRRLSPTSSGVLKQLLYSGTVKDLGFT
jgi:hypothetical protein